MTDAASHHATTDDVVLEVRGVTKRFPGVIANEDVDISLHRGEILCLLGENGAGKSTLMNTVFGLYAPDEGSIHVHGEPVHFSSSRDAIAAGIGMVHQHFQLIPVLTVAENVILGLELTKGPLLDLEAARQRVAELGQQYGLAVDPDALVGELSVGAQQRVELIKALYRDAEILILDEPTAVLTPGEVDDFFAVVRGLVARGKSIVFITHKLREVLAVADRIAVLRRGRIVGTADPATATQQELATLMVGRAVSFSVTRTPATPGEVVLKVRGLQVADDRGTVQVRNLDLDVRAGEIVGLAGVGGNGQREFVEAVAGMRRALAGTILLSGTSLLGRTPRQVHDLGVGHVPEDRRKHGLVESFTLVDNVLLNRYHGPRYSRHGLLDRGNALADTEALIAQFDVRTPSAQVSAGNLSGGNQQKLVVAREMSSPLKLLIVAQPTRGLDVGSIEFIHTQIVAQRDAGVAVLLISAELDEVLSLSDRVGVLYRGNAVAMLDSADATRERVGLLMASGRGDVVEGAA